jgi:hypothetical protein
LTVTSVSVPASTTTTAGDTFIVTARLPVPNDGGADDAAVPHVLFGLADSENASSPPPARTDSGRYVLSVVEHRSEDSSVVLPPKRRAWDA